MHIICVLCQILKKELFTLALFLQLVQLLFVKNKELDIFLCIQTIFYVLT